MKFLCSVFVVLSMILTIGCGGPSVPKAPPVSPEKANLDDVKVRLENFVQTGIVGSGIAGLKEKIQKLPADKSGPLLESLDKLNAAATPAKVKEIAKSMIEKL